MFCLITKPFLLPNDISTPRVRADSSSWRYKLGDQILKQSTQGTEEVSWKQVGLISVNIASKDIIWCTLYLMESLVPGKFYRTSVNVYMNAGIFCASYTGILVCTEYNVTCASGILVAFLPAVALSPNRRKTYQTEVRTKTPSLISTVSPPFRLPPFLFFFFFLVVFFVHFVSLLSGAMFVPPPSLPLYFLSSFSLLFGAFLVPSLFFFLSSLYLCRFLFCKLDSGKRGVCWRGGRRPTRQG